MRTEELANRAQHAADLFKHGKNIEAEKEYRSLVASMTVNLGGAHPDTISARKHLAIVLEAVQKHSDVE